MIQRASEKVCGTISGATIAGFLKSFEDKWLLDTPSVREKLATVEGQKLQDRNLLYWKIASINPEKIFAWLLPLTKWAFTRGFHVFAVFSISMGFLLIYLNCVRFSGGVGRLFTLDGLFS